MSAIIETSGGKITYTDDCIASIAGMATTECYGVVGMSPVNKMKDSLADILSKENVKRGAVCYCAVWRVNLCCRFQYYFYSEI